MKEFGLENQAVELELLVEGPDCEDCGYDENCPGLRRAWLSWVPEESDEESEWESGSDSDCSHEGDCDCGNGPSEHDCRVN